jgi:hypothetical protein
VVCFLKAKLRIASHYLLGTLGRRYFAQPCLSISSSAQLYISSFTAFSIYRHPHPPRVLSSQHDPPFFEPLVPAPPSIHRALNTTQAPYPARHWRLDKPLTFTHPTACTSLFSFETRGVHKQSHNRTRFTTKLLFLRSSVSSLSITKHSNSTRKSRNVIISNLGYRHAIH